jgi:hypothetical protein
MHQDLSGNLGAHQALEKRTGQSYEEYKEGRRSFPPKKVYDLAFFSSRKIKFQ